MEKVRLLTSSGEDLIRYARKFKSDIAYIYFQRGRVGVVCRIVHPYRKFELHAPRGDKELSGLMEKFGQFVVENSESNYIAMDDRTHVYKIEFGYLVRHLREFVHSARVPHNFEPA